MQHSKQADWNDNEARKTIVTQEEKQPADKQPASQVYPTKKRRRDALKASLKE